MANITTLAQIITQIRQRADYVNNDFVDDAELTSYINQSYADIYDLLVGAFEDYYLAEHTFSTVNDTQSYALPTDFYKAKGVDVKFTTDRYRTIERFMWINRNAYNGSGFWSDSYYTSARYAILGNEIKFIPIPSSVTEVLLYYIPTYTKLVDSGDEIDGNMTGQGWEEYIINDCAAKIMEKEESDSSNFIRRKMEIRERIEEMAANRDAEEPYSVRDASRGNGGWDVY